MDLEQVRSAAGRAIDCFTNNQPDSVTYVDIDRLARFAAAMLDETPATANDLNRLDGYYVEKGARGELILCEEKSDLTVTTNPTRAELARLCLALGLPLTAGGE